MIIIGDYKGREKRADGPESTISQHAVNFGKLHLFDERLANSDDFH
jgi:hypothetical protein